MQQNLEMKGGKGYLLMYKVKEVPMEAYINTSLTMNIRQSIC